jgi:signal transduction histidine kinase
MDFRFHSAIRDYLISIGLRDQYDLVSLAGATKGLVDQDPETEAAFLKQIKLSRELHSIQEVFLIHHTDCGAYGGKKAFVSDREEHEKHDSHLRKATSIISLKFPGLVVHRVLARLHDDGEISFEKLG